MIRGLALEERSAGGSASLGGQAPGSDARCLLLRTGSLATHGHRRVTRPGRLGALGEGMPVTAAACGRVQVQPIGSTLVLRQAVAVMQACRCRIRLR